MATPLARGYACALWLFSRPMTLHLSLGPLIALVAGILILVFPRLLSTIVALYLILVGVLGLVGMHQWRVF